MSAAIVRQLNALPVDSFGAGSFHFRGFRCDRARMKAGALQVRTCELYEPKHWMNCANWIRMSYAEEDREEAFRGGFYHCERNGGNRIKLAGVDYPAQSATD